MKNYNDMMENITKKMYQNIYDEIKKSNMEESVKGDLLLPVEELAEHGHKRDEKGNVAVDMFSDKVSDVFSDKDKRNQMLQEIEKSDLSNNTKNMTKILVNGI